MELSDATANRLVLAINLMSNHGPNKKGYEFMARVLIDIGLEPAEAIARLNAVIALKGN